MAKSVESKVVIPEGMVQVEYILDGEFAKIGETIIVSIERANDLKEAGYIK